MGVIVRETFRRWYRRQWLFNSGFEEWYANACATWFRRLITVNCPNCDTLLKAYISRVQTQETRISYTCFCDIYDYEFEVWVDAKFCGEHITLDKRNYED